MQNSEDRLLTPLDLTVSFTPFLDVEHILAGVACKRWPAPRKRATKLFAAIFVRNTAG